jgi:hypothetical protein
VAAGAAGDRLHRAHEPAVPVLELLERPVATVAGIDVCDGQPAATAIDGDASVRPP